MKGQTDSFEIIIKHSKPKLTKTEA